MKPLEAEEILNKYGAVLEKCAPLVFGAPETLLPFDQETIKQAFKVVLKFLKKNPKAFPGDLTAHMELLKTGYIHLANFVGEEDARITAAAGAAVISNNVDHPGWSSMDRALQISERNTQAMKILGEEFDIFLDGI